MKSEWKRKIKTVKQIEKEREKVKRMLGGRCGMKGKRRQEMWENKEIFGAKRIKSPELSLSFYLLVCMKFL